MCPLIINLTCVPTFLFFRKVCSHDISHFKLRHLVFKILAKDFWDCILVYPLFTPLYSIGNEAYNLFIRHRQILFFMQGLSSAYVLSFLVLGLYNDYSNGNLVYDQACRCYANDNDLLERAVLKITGAPCFRSREDGQIMCLRNTCNAKFFQTVNVNLWKTSFQSQMP